MPASSPPEPTAATLRAALEAAATEADRERTEARRKDPATPVIGVRMGTVFDLARAHQRMPLAEVDRLLGDDAYEVRVAAVSVLDFKARAPRLSDEEHRAMFDLWMRRIDRIDSWDYIDRAAPRVLGGYLLDRPRDVLFELARSETWWHRRTAITAAFAIIRARDLDDPLALCELLADDPVHFVQTNVGVALREIGRVDPARLEDFLARRGGDLSAHARRTARSAFDGRSTA